MPFNRMAIVGATAGHWELLRKLNDWRPAGVESNLKRMRSFLRVMSPKENIARNLKGEGARITKTRGD